MAYHYLLRGLYPQCNCGFLADYKRQNEHVWEIEDSVLAHINQISDALLDAAKAVIHSCISCPGFHLNEFHGALHEKLRNAIKLAEGDS